jgi:hypothetical protein
MERAMEDQGPLKGFGFSCGTWPNILFLQEMCVTIGIWPRMHDVVCAEQLIYGGMPFWNTVLLSVFGL